MQFTDRIWTDYFFDCLYRFVIPFVPTLFHVFLIFSPVLPLKKLKKVLHYFSPPKNHDVFVSLIL